jgi:hypothetical protein
MQQSEDGLRPTGDQQETNQELNFTNIMLGFLEDEDSILGALGVDPTATEAKVSNDPYEFVHDEKAPCGFVGLLNQGATCYLNSLFQALFFTPQLRKSLFSLSYEELGIALLETSGPSQEAIEELKSLGLGFSENQIFAALSKFPDPGQRELAINAILEGSIQIEAKPKGARKIPIEMQRLFAELQVERIISWFIDLSLGIELQSYWYRTSNLELWMEPRSCWNSA